jgi:excisionase family DNA binding protein
MGKTLLEHFLNPPEPLMPRELLRTRKPKARKSRSKLHPRLLSTRDAAEYIGVSEWKLRQMVHAGEIDYVAGKNWRFDVQSLDRWIEQNREKRL